MCGWNMKGPVLDFDNSRNIVLSNWRQRGNVGGDGSWPDWAIKMAGELTPSVRLRIVARFLMRCLLLYQEAPRASIFIYRIFLPRINTDGHGCETGLTQRRGERGGAQRI